MLDFLESMPPRSFFTGAGTVLSLVTAFLLIFIEYRFTWRALVMAALMGVISSTSGIGGMLARKLMYGGWTAPAAFFGGIFEYEGTHYAGAVLYIMWLTPLLWRLIMRRESGVFCKEGLGRFMGIMSVYAIIQAFVGRIGCLPAGCCHGRPYHGALAVPCVGVEGLVMPALQTELILLLITLALVLFFYIKRRNTAPVLCIGYGISVFVSEFMFERLGTVTVFGLTIIQIIAAALITTGLVIIYRSNSLVKTTNFNP